MQNRERKRKRKKKTHLLGIKRKTIAGTGRQEASYTLRKRGDKEAYTPNPLQIPDDMVEKVYRRHYPLSTLVAAGVIVPPAPPDSMEHGLHSQYVNTPKKKREVLKKRQKPKRVCVSPARKSQGSGWKSIASIRSEAREYVNELRDDAEWEKEFWKHKQEQPLLEYPHE
jgi:hypothetical protein